MQLFGHHSCISFLCLSCCWNDVEFNVTRLSIIMASLLELSNELLHNIFVHVEPLALDNLTATCQSIRSYIKSNRLLGKEIYLRRYVGAVIETLNLLLT